MIQIHNNEELARMCNVINSSGCDFVLLSSPANITYVSGYEVPLPVGPITELMYSGPLALVEIREPESWLIVDDSLLINKAMEQCRLDHIVTFNGFNSFKKVNFRTTYLQALHKTLHDANLSNRKAILGIEGSKLPYSVAQKLVNDFPKLRLVEVESYMKQARLIKTPNEIELLRRAAHVCDVGQMELAELVKEAGSNEFELWIEVILKIYKEVGHHIPVIGELVTGARTSGAPYPGGPLNRTAKVGDGVTMDISLCLNGYWSDCCNSHIIGKVNPTPDQLKYARASQKACEAAIEALRPGVLASQVWKAAEAELRSHGLTMAHHAGHQLGVTVNELPRLVPYDQTPIQKNMIFAVELGAYEGSGGTFGTRSEKVVLVTEDGPEIISNFKWGI